MAYTVSVSDVIQRAKDRADMAHTDFVSDTEWLQYFNEAYTEFYDELVMMFQNYFFETAELTINSANPIVDLPADFYKILSMEFEVGNNSYIPIQPFNEGDRNAFVSPATSLPSGTIRLRYVPNPTIFTALDSFDAVSGWEAVIVTDMAIMALDKEESNTDRLERRRRRIMERLASAAQNRDIYMPGTVTDTYTLALLRPYASLRYRLYGDKVEFISEEAVSSDSMWLVP